MSELNLRPLPDPGPSLTERVYDTIARMLLDSSLKPDSRTSIRELAEGLGVSTMPVRIAVGHLIAQGALTIRKNRAVEVPRMSVDEFRELTHTRLLVECEAARLAVGQIGDAEVDQIRSLHESFRDEITAGNRSTALILNRQLHFALYAAARAPTLCRMIEMAWLRVGPLISLDIGRSSKSRDGRVSHSISAHGRLVAALELRDTAAAADAIRFDISGAAEKILDQHQYFQTEGVEYESRT